MLTATPVVKRRELPQLAMRVFHDTALQAIADQRAMIKKTILIVRADTARCFDKQRSPEGKKWSPLQHPRPGSKGSDKVMQDQGLLRAAATSDAPGSICRITGGSLIMGVSLVQARILNDGGVITPKNGKFLAIPATVEAKRCKSARNFPRKLSCIINKAGTGGVLVEYVRKKQRGKKNKGKQRGAASVVQYYLTKEVTIPARPFIGISDKGIDEIQEAWVDHYWEAMKKATRRRGGFIS